MMVALRAHTLFFRDQQYVVQDDEVVIVDEFTGRLMVGRRWSDGLHQAVEAKEGVKIQHENQTLASITFQNYFRMYDKLSGMTGTADTEAYEFQEIYTWKPSSSRPTSRWSARTRTTRSSRRRKRNTRRSSTTSATATSAASRCWWAPPASRTPSCWPACCARPSFAARGPQRQTARARRRSSPRPASRATSPSPPTWPAAAPTSCWAAASTSRST